MTKDCEAGAPCVFSDEDLQASAASRVSAADQQKRPVDSEQEMAPGGMVARQSVAGAAQKSRDKIARTLSVCRAACVSCCGFMPIFFD